MIFSVCCHAERIIHNIEHNPKRRPIVDELIPLEIAQRMIAMIKKFFLFFLRIFRRALCCFSRKRCDSNSQFEGRLEAVNVVNDSPNYKKSNTVSFFLPFLIDDIKLCENSEFPMQMERDWNSWDDKPRTIEEHIESYRENLVKAKEPEPVVEVENIDLFGVSLSDEL